MSYESGGEWSEGKEYGEIMRRIEKPSQDVKEPGFEESWDIFEQSGSIYSVPYIAEGALYFGGMDRFLYALDAETGEMLWKFMAGDVIVSSPVFFDGRVFFGSYDGYLYCLSKDGRLLWKFLTGGIVPCSPVVVSDAVYFGSGDKHFYALDAETGKIKWKFLAGDGIINTPAAVNGMIIFGSFDRHYYALSMSEGKLLWKFPVDGVPNSACIADNNFRLVHDVRIRAHEKSPEIKEGFIYFGARDNHCYCLDLEGKLIWKFLAGSMVTGPTTISDGCVYSGTWDGNVWCVDARTGKQKWFCKTGGIVASTPVIHNGVVYFGSSDQNFYAADAKDGKILWKFHTGGFIGSPPSDVWNDRISFGSFDTLLYCLDIKKRSVVWTFQTGFGFQAKVEKIKNIFEEIDRKIFRVWKPETTGKKETFQPVPSKYGGMSPVGLKYAGESVYKSSNPYETRKDEKKRFPPFMR